MIPQDEKVQSSVAIQLHYRTIKSELIWIKSVRSFVFLFFRYSQLYDSVEIVSSASTPETYRFRNLSIRKGRNLFMIYSAIFNTANRFSNISASFANLSNTTISTSRICRRPFCGRGVKHDVGGFIDINSEQSR